MVQQTQGPEVDTSSGRVDGGGACCLKQTVQKCRISQEQGTVKWATQK